MGLLFFLSKPPILCLGIRRLLFVIRDCDLLCAMLWYLPILWYLPAFEQVASSFVLCNTTMSSELLQLPFCSFCFLFNHLCLPSSTHYINLSSLPTEVIVPRILAELCGPEVTPTQHLETQQALVKQFAEILEFTLKFDELKVVFTVMLWFAFFLNKSACRLYKFCQYVLMFFRFVAFW